VARRLGVGEDKVRHWIMAGELKAMNAATRANGRPRYLIDLDDLAAFERARSTPPTPTPPTPRRRRQAEGIIAFF
jgi:hypothetical protein